MGVVVRLRCALAAQRRELRVSIREMGRRTKVPYGVLSQIERGLMLPRDEWIERIELHYQLRREEWYSGEALVLVADGHAGVAERGA